MSQNPQRIREASIRDAELPATPIMEQHVIGSDIELKGSPVAPSDIEMGIFVDALSTIIRRLANTPST